MANILCVILDINPVSLGHILASTNGSSGQQQPLDVIWDHVITFLSAYMAQSPDNSLQVSYAGSTLSRILLCDKTRLEPWNPSKLGLEFKEALMEDLDAVEQIAHETKRDESFLAGALSKALCLINSMKRAHSSAIKPHLGRVLVLKLSRDSNKQYMSLMNASFTANKQQTIIDSCIFTKSPSILLQQAADITGGITMDIINTQELLQKLLTGFLPSADLRKILVQPLNRDIDYRPACFCHQSLVDVGFVCSVCLSVFCTFKPICPTCDSVFNFLPGKKKKG